MERNGLSFLKEMAKDGGHVPAKGSLARRRRRARTLLAKKSTVEASAR